MAPSSQKPIVVIPVFLRSQEDGDTTMDAVKSVRKTVGGQVDLLLVDDCSPEQGLVDRLAEQSEPYRAELVRKEENEGFSKTVNVGLRRALNEGRDAVLMNADVEMVTKDWLHIARETSDRQGRPAAVVGALLMFPSGLIQHAGIYFSLLTRTFDHRFKFAPMNLREAHVPQVCPVTGAFQFIRHETLESVGVYDERFKMGWEDVSFCIDTFQAGLDCLYQPKIRAYHHEAMFRGRQNPKIEEWTRQSWWALADKYRDTSFAQWVTAW